MGSYRKIVSSLDWDWSDEARLQTCKKDHKRTQDVVDISNGCNCLRFTLFECLADQIGDLIGSDIYGRFLSLDVQFSECARFSSEPLMDAPNSWHMYLWKAKNDSLKITSDYAVKPDVSTMVVNALQAKDLDWLGNVPLDKLILLRKNGELSDLRDLLRKEVEQVKNASETEVAEIAKRVEYNLTEAFKKHSRELNELKSKYKSQYKIDSGLLVTGGITLAASLVCPAVSILGLLGGAGVIDLYRTYRDKRKEFNSLKTRPVGILFDTRSESTNR